MVAIIEIADELADHKAKQYFLQTSLFDSLAVQA